MPWLALPWNQTVKKNELSTRFQIQGIPSLIVLNGSDLSVIDADGRSTISKIKGNIKKAIEQWDSQEKNKAKHVPLELPLAGECKAE